MPCLYFLFARFVPPDLTWPGGPRATLGSVAEGHPSPAQSSELLCFVFQKGAGVRERFLMPFGPSKVENVEYDEKLGELLSSKKIYLISVREMRISRPALTELHS